MGGDVLEVYADVWCPFAYVGLLAARAERDRQDRDDVTMLVRSWPLELVNGRPQSPQATEHHVTQLRAQVAPTLFAGFDAKQFPHTTLPALALSAAAYRHDAVVGEAVSFELRRALFEEGVDVSRVDVLGDVAAHFGIDDENAFDESSVIDDWRSGRDRGVKGSPHFFCGETEAYCPSLDIERDNLGELTLKRNAKELRRFLRGCFHP